MIKGYGFARAKRDIQRSASTDIHTRTTKLVKESIETVSQWETALKTLCFVIELYKKLHLFDGFTLFA